MNTEEINEKLSALVKHITETGEWVLNPSDLKLIKSYCKRSDVLVNTVFELVMRQLRKKHAQIRYSSLQLIEQLFDRSKFFRDLLTEDFPVFTQLTVGIQDKKLPPPVKVAAKLKDYAIALVKAWYIKYGERYLQLGVAFDYLLNNGYMVKDSNSLSNIHASNKSSSSTDARKKAIQLSRYDLLKADIEDHMDIIQDNLTNMEGCFEILIPKNDFVNDDIDFDALMRGEVSSKQTQDDTYKENLISHGLGSSRYKITVDLSEDALTEDVEETDDNHIIFDQLREAYTVLETKHISQLNGWINALVKIDINDKAEKERLISKLINLKGRATEEARKAKLLNIQVSHREAKPITAASDEEDDEYQDELFEEVDVPDNMENEDTNIPNSSKLPPLQRIFPLSFEPSMIEDATYNGPKIQENSAKDLHTVKGKEKADPMKEDLLKRAPVVEWGEDLYYWDKTNVQFNTSGIEKSHRFMGVGEGNNEMPEHLLEDLRKRTIYYKSEAPKEIQACKHPLRNGGLCPRKDLITCPFHGIIIPRNDVGIPLDPSAAAAESMEASSSKEQMESDAPPSVMKNLWELLEGDAMEQSGHERVITSKSKGRKKKEKSALIDIRKKQSTSLTRLKRQVNAPKTKKMVEQAIEYEREMKSRNKQANSWK